MRIAILTPDPEDPAYQGRWSQVRDRMVGPLAALSVEVESRSWIEVEDWNAFDLVLPLTAWGYHRDHFGWLNVTDGWEFSRAPVLNPPSVLRWNSDKRYLDRLQRLALPVIPTVFVDELDQAALDRAIDLCGSEELVVKPQVSASAYQTSRVRPGQVVQDPPEGPAMIQPYMGEVAFDGELSLIYLGGQFSHAIRKVARTGDFRVQPEWGGRISEYRPDADVLAAADRILEHVEEPLLYARVDMVRGPDRKPLLMELELIEPDLYLDFDPLRGEGFARAVAAAAAASR